MPVKANLDYFNLDNINIDQLKDIKAQTMLNMFQAEENPVLQELAYLAFLVQGPWGVDFNIPRGVQRIAMDLNLPNTDIGLSWTECQLNPAIIWSTQDQLEQGRLNMVEIAYKYMIKRGKPIPPIAVWHIKSSRFYRYVVHDGHHRVYMAAQMNLLIPTIKLEYWIDNSESPILEKKLNYKEVNTLCINLPITQFCTL